MVDMILTLLYYLSLYDLGIAWPALAFISALFLKHHELRKTVRNGDAAEA